MNASDEDGRGIIRIHGDNPAIDECLRARSTMRIVDHPVVAGAEGFRAAKAQLGFLIAGDFITRFALAQSNLSRRGGGGRIIAGLSQFSAFARTHAEGYGNPDQVAHGRDSPLVRSSAFIPEELNLEPFHKVS